jgi:hypothetical protein
MGRFFAALKKFIHINTFPLSKKLKMLETDAKLSQANEKHFNISCFNAWL